MLLRLDLTLYCQLSVLRKTLPFVMSCFCGIVGGSSLQIAFQPPLDSWGLCPDLCFTLGGEKSSRLSVDLHLPGAKKFFGPILCLCGAVFDVGCADDGQRKNHMDIPKL